MFNYTPVILPLILATSVITHNVTPRFLSSSINQSNLEIQERGSGRKTQLLSEDNSPSSQERGSGRRNTPQSSFI